MKLNERIDLAVARLIRLGIPIRPAEATPWIAEIESKLDRPLPEVFRSLTARYIFSSFELGPVLMFSNLGDSSYDDITAAPFHDPMLSAWLIDSGYFHFGRTTTGSYDPICLDLKASLYPKTPTSVIQFDHECILQQLPSVERQVLAESFLDLLESAPAKLLE